MTFNETEQHIANRYSNAKTLIQSLIEIGEFHGGAETPAKWENAKIKISKLSEEELNSLKDILYTFENILYNINGLDEFFSDIEERK